jgi:hypothetical protein
MHYKTFIIKIKDIVIQPFEKYIIDIQNKKYIIDNHLLENVFDNNLVEVEQPLYNKSFTIKKGDFIKLIEVAIPQQFFENLDINTFFTGNAIQSKRYSIIEKANEKEIEEYILKNPELFI